MTRTRRRPSPDGRRAPWGAALAAALVFVPVTAFAADPTAPSAATAAPALTAPVDAAPSATMNFVVNAEPGTATTEAAEAAVIAEGGTVLAAWDEIGVVTARSTAADFAQRVRASSAVESAGPTRTAAVRTVSDGPDAAGGVADSSATDSSATDSHATDTHATDAVATGVQSTGLADRVGDTTDVADPAEARQWGDEAVHAAEARAVQPGSADVLVGVLDSGVDATHPDLVSQVDPAASVGCSVDGVADTAPAAWAPSPEASTDTREHGTHVAGIIAAADDGRGVVGVAPGVRLASVKVVDADGFIYPEYAICGYMWAAQQGMDVTNASFFVDPWASWCSADADQAAALEAVGRAVAWSRHEGVLDVAAVGNATTGALATDLAHKTTDSLSPNDSTPRPGRDVSQGCVQLPAETDGVVTVSSAQQGIGGSIEKSRFSNFGAGVVDLTAPGSTVLSTVPGGGFAALSGTSMAAPHVAAVAALLVTGHPDATPAELSDLLARQAGGEAPAEYFGAGLVDAFAAVTEDLGLGPVVVAPDGTLRAGAAGTLRGANFVPGETVEVVSDSLDEATSAVADARGRVELPVRFAPSTAPGPVVVAVVGSSGSRTTSTVDVQEALAGPVVTSPTSGVPLTSGPVVVDGTALDSARVTVTVEAAGGDPASVRAAAVGPRSLTVRAEQDGAFRATFEGLASGDWQVSAVMATVDDIVSARGQAVLFSIEPAVAPLPGSDDGAPGDSGTVPVTPGAGPTDDIVPGGVAVGLSGREIRADPTRASSALAWTGSDPQPIGLAALLIVALGIVGVAVGRRPISSPT